MVGQTEVIQKRASGKRQAGADHRPLAIRKVLVPMLAAKKRSQNLPFLDPPNGNPEMY
jgi:hypothetical protein